MTSPGPKTFPSAGAGFRLALVALALLYLLVFKLCFGDGSFPLLVIGWVIEGCLLGWIFLLGRGLARVLLLRRAHIDAVVFYLLWWLHFVAIFSHDFFFREAAERRFSLLDLSPTSAFFFLGDVLPGWGLLLLILSLGGLLAGAFLLRHRNVRLPSAPLASALAGLSLVAFCATRLVPAFPSPPIDLIDDLTEVLSYPAVRESDQEAPPLSPESLDRSRREFPELQTRFRKVLVFVMEGTTQRTLFDNIEWLPKDVYFKTLRRFWHGYPGYRSCNQDSRTGELSLLTSRFVPFEAYSEEGASHYLHLSRESTLLDLFNRNGFETAYASSQVEQELVVTDLPWSQRIHLDEAQIAEARGFLCFNPFEFEHSCEDRILLPRLFEFIDQNERAFLFYVFVWGHSYDYYQASGIPNVKYYADFVQALLKHLEERGQLDDTLIVITSDHGVRDREYWTDPSAYRIPLLFINPRFENRETPGLFSHVDFADLLLYELGERPQPPSGHDFILFTGPTYSSILGAITKDDELWVIKDRPWISTLLGHTPPPQGPGLTGGDPWPFLNLYHRYRSGFQPVR